MDNRFDVVNPRHVPSWFWRAFVHSHVVQKIYVWMMKKLFGLRIRNLELVPPPGPYIFSANHGSHYDLFLALAAFRDISGQMPVSTVWDGAYAIPVISGILKALPCIAVDTQPGRDVERMAALREMIAHLRAGRCLVIGSEGERRDQLGEFEGGAALLSLHTGVRIVPVSLRGVRGLFSDLSWPDRYWGKVEIILHAPLDPSEFEAGGGSRAEVVARLTTAIREQVASQLDYAAKT
jgi:1-acyl-sn-glycerol-3-phosphate acyltransferase